MFSHLFSSLIKTFRFDAPLARASAKGEEGLCPFARFTMQNVPFLLNQKNKPQYTCTSTVHHTTSELELGSEGQARRKKGSGWPGLAR